MRPTDTPLLIQHKDCGPRLDFIGLPGCVVIIRDDGIGNTQRSRFAAHAFDRSRSEEHTSELQSRSDLVCRLLLEKKKQRKVDSVFSTALRRMGGLVLHMLGPFAMALIARNTQLIIATVLHRATPRFELE